MATQPKSKLIERAEAEGLTAEVAGGGWYIVEGEKVRGLDSLEEAIDAAVSGPTLTACLCGCGTEVKGRFALGHDAKLKSVLLRVARHEMGPPAIPEVARPHLEELDSLLGQHDETIADVLAVVREKS